MNSDEKDILIKQYIDQINELKAQIGKQQPAKDDSLSIQSVLKSKAEQIEQERRKQEALTEKLRAIEDQITTQQKEITQIKAVMERRATINRIASEADVRPVEREPSVASQTSREIGAEGETVVPDQVRRLQEELRAKKQELDDLESENLDSKLSLITELKNQTKMIKFYRALIDQQVGKSDLNRLRLQSQWSDKENCYNVPLFTVENSKVVFARLPRHEMLNIMKKTFDQRKLLIQESAHKPTSEETTEKRVDRSSLAAKKSSLASSGFPSSQEKTSVRSDFPAIRHFNMPQTTKLSVVSAGKPFFPASSEPTKEQADPVLGPPLSIVKLNKRIKLKHIEPPPPTT